MNRVLEQIEESRRRCLCTLILDVAFGILSPRSEPLSKRATRSFFLFCLLSLVNFVVSYIFRDFALARLPPILMGALVTSLSVYVVAWCHNYALYQLRTVFQFSTISTEFEEFFLDWLRRYAKILPQVLFSVTSVVIVISFVLILDGTIGLPFKWPKSYYVGLAITTFGLGQGGYWAIVTPMLAHLAKKCGPACLHLYRFNPSKSSILLTLSRIYTTYAYLCALMITLCFVGLILLRPDFRGTSIVYLLLLILGGYFITCWTFLFPQLALSYLIRQEKVATLSSIQGQIQRLTENLSAMSVADLQRIETLTKLHDAVISTSNTVLTFNAIRAFITALVVPTIMAALSKVNWSQIFN